MTIGAIIDGEYCSAVCPLRQSAGWCKHHEAPLPWDSKEQKRKRCPECVKAVDEFLGELAPEEFKTLPDPDISVLKEALALVHGERQVTYGHPSESFDLIAKLWSTHTGFEFTAEMVVECMILLKLARERRKHKSDNLVDIAGYAEVLSLIHEHRDGG